MTTPMTELLANIAAYAKFLENNLDQVSEGIGLYVNANKT